MGQRPAIPEFRDAAGAARRGLRRRIVGWSAVLLLPGLLVAVSGVQLIDVRAAHEYEAGHIAGSRWIDKWTINGKSFPKTDDILVKANRRYRLVFDNRSDEAHPVHLHRHTFELTKVGGVNTSGVFKDVVVVQPKSTVEADLLADNPGATLFHCHQQMHMDYGFMALMRYVS